MRSLSPNMKAHLWSMLKHLRAESPTSIPMLDERTAQALVRRGLLVEKSEGYVLNVEKAQAALSRVRS